jgi:uncharacterized NAD(P)/FAD-binding protein YdhS
VSRGTGERPTGSTPLGNETGEPRGYDLVFVGAGASTSYVLLALLDALMDEPPAAPLRICVAERAPDPFTGVPYGTRAARTSLMITALRDFLPDAERALFVEWLSANKDWVFDEFVAEDGPLSARWWSRHQEAVRQDDFDHLFLPRYTFGEYLARRTRAALARAERAGVAATEVVRDDVVSIERTDGRYLVHCRRRSVCAPRVVLATGSAPVRPRLPRGADLAGPALIDDPFDDMTEAVGRIRSAMAQRPEGRPGHVVVIGGNAGTMDMLYQLNNVLDPRAQQAVFTVLSPSGQLPERVSDQHVPEPFRPERLEALSRADAVQAVSIYRAAVADIAWGRAAGLLVADTLAPISAAVVRLLHLLSEDQAAEFADRWGVELGRHQRRAGWEYCEVVEELTAEDRIRVVAGSFIDVVTDERAGARVRFETAGRLHELERPVDAVVNCGGPARSLAHTAPPLLAQLVTAGLCRPTPSGGGIAVDPSLEAAPGLFVMGPLLAGNVVRGAPVWHMEHCGRISAFGSALGAELARPLVTVAG